MAVLPQPPIWLQNGQYSARRDRAILDLLFDEGVFNPGGGDFEVTERGIGANNTVDVAAGRAVVEGDDEPNQGEYLVVLEALINVSFGPAPLSDARIDLLVLQVNDSTAGSTRTPADIAELKVIEGTVDPSPVPPALPDTAIPLAEVLRTNGDTAITNAMITDQRPTASQATYTVNSRFQVLTTAERNALTPFTGQTIFNSDENTTQTWDGSQWVSFGGTFFQAVTTAERNALTPFVGQTIFNTDTNEIQVWTGSQWNVVGSTSFQALTTAQRNALTPFLGQTIFNTDTDEIQVWTGSVWDVVGVAPPPVDPIPLILALS